MQSFFTKQGAWIWPIVAMLVITPFTPSLDLATSSYFYQGNNHFTQNSFYWFIYYFGSIPAIITCLMALAMVIASYNYPKHLNWRKPALVLFLSFTIGSGLITNLMLKDHWGRPRPKQTIEFGGKQHFRAYYQPNFFNQPEPSKSFPSGHCTMGFYFFALALVGKRLGDRYLVWLGICLAISLGSILALTRIAQGGHFLSDTLMSALVMWLTAYFCDKWVYSDERKEDERSNQKTA